MGSGEGADVGDVAMVMRKNLFRYLTLGIALLLLSGHAWSQSKTLLIMGDSLSAAYGLESTEAGWVHLLDQRLAPNLTVINASISGETTRGGLQRLPSLLTQYQPEFVVLALGGNDGLQGQPIADIRGRLSEMLEQILQANATPILVGIRLPPNYGPRYTEPFFALFTELADQYSLEYFVPFMLAELEQQADFSAWMQADGVHPTAAAQPMIVETIWSALPMQLKEAHD
jgi:acyl-CoA thioesterase-1